jgi:hypothetical protein
LFYYNNGVYEYRAGSGLLSATVKTEKRNTGLVYPRLPAQCSISLFIESYLMNSIISLIAPIKQIWLNQGSFLTISALKSTPFY